MAKLFKFILISVSVLAIIGTVLTVFAAIYLNKYRSSSVDPELLNISYGSQKTEFYYYDFSDRESREGTPILIENCNIANVKYKFTPLSGMSEHLKNAFIAIEDKRFYSHSGVDYIRTASAAFNYVFGTGDFGGSTITQQLVKNLTGEDEFSIERKLKEAFSAINLEESYDKTQILETYLNIINLSDGCRGVGAASEYFFSKTPSALTLPEAATIASITNNPSYYNPQKHPENNKKRRDTVLLCMLEQGFIDELEYREAIATPIELNMSEKYSAEKVNSWYIDTVTEDVIDDLAKEYGITKSSAALMLSRGGYKIYTAMDKEIQETVEGYYSELSHFPADRSGSYPQSSIIIIDQRNGDILGISGAIGKKSGNRIQNFATTTRRPSGSAIKPLSVYAPAIEKGIINWSTVIEDSPVRTVNGKPWPSNVNKQYAGRVDVKEAVEHSLNTVAVKVLEMLGNEESMSFLKESLLISGLDEEKDIGAASLALGQHSEGITLRELTAAYSIFDDGVMSKPRSYYKVTDSFGRVILDNTALDKAVISRENAAIMTKLLENVVDDGSAKNGISLDKKINVAGKTGTSGDNKDRYFIGYTPELLCGVWYGYEYPKDLSYFGNNKAMLLWDRVMTRIYERTSSVAGIEDFDVPPGVQRLSYDPETGELITSRADAEKVKNGWFDVKHIQ